MKLKKLLKVLAYRQPIRIVIEDGVTITKDNVQCWDDYFRPLRHNIAEYKVTSVRNVHDELLCKLPDWQDYIEIKIQPIQGGIDND